MRPAFRFQFPSALAWAFLCVGVAAFAFLLRVYIGVWTPEHGITKFLQAGREFDERGTALFRATPKYLDPYPAHRWGFDGQLYAQMALHPLLRDPQLHVALDDPPYRARRILLSWLAWLGGLGRPFWVINVYAAMNLIFWIGFAWLAGRMFRPHGWSGVAGYAAVLLTCGILESMHASLTDFPSFTLILGALVLGGNRGAGVLSLAALARPESAIGFVGLAEVRPPWREALKKNVVLAIIAALPATLWIGYVLWRFWGRELSMAGGNLAWPLQGIMEKLGEFSVTAVVGSIRWHRWLFELYKNYELHALLTIIAVLTQSVYLFLHRDWQSRLWRWAAVVAIYFSCISFLSWESHFTITRHALPITFVFNLMLAARPTRAWLIWFLLGNCFVPFGPRYFDRLRDYHAPPPPMEFNVIAQRGTAAPVEIIFGNGWSPQQWEDDSTWRWSRGSSATLRLRNMSGRTVRGELSFLTRTRKPRTVRALIGGRLLLERELTPVRGVFTLPAIELPPGETMLEFHTDAPADDSDDTTSGKVTFKMEDPILRVGVLEKAETPREP